jgi:hypothetical protein
MALFEAIWREADILVCQARVMCIAYGLNDMVAGAYVPLANGRPQRYTAEKEA